MIFVDSNVPMYLMGVDPTHKRDVQRVLETLIAQGQRLVTDAEVFQEILHRYISINRRQAIQPAFDALFRIVDEVLPLDVQSVVRAKDIATGHQQLSARDAVHLAIMERHGIEHILTFDSGFDSLPGITRVH